MRNRYPLRTHLFKLHSAPVLFALVACLVTGNTLLANGKGALPPLAFSFSGVSLAGEGALKVQQSVSGTVLDSNGQPLPGASILEKGTMNGTQTDFDGNFTITLSNDDAVLVISYIGFLSQEIPVAGQTSINVQLKEDAARLDEVVVVGYGTQKKNDLTGAIASVQEEDFTQGVNNSALQLLNGRAAGVYVSQSSSAPGAAISVRVRGAGSINSSNQVLVVVDGLPGAPTQALSPEDIESVQVLKDASAAAIYGTRAANGVILITTKKGKAGATKVNYSTYIGTQDVAQRIEMLNGREYAQVLNDLAVDGGQQPRFTQAEIDAIGQGTDWQDEVFRTAFVQNHQMSISGGTENSNYYLGLNHLDQDGIVLGSGFQRYNVRYNQEIKASDKFTFKFNVNVNRNVTQRILSSNAANESAGPINTALQFDPTIPATRGEDGRFPRSDNITLENPLALVNGVGDETAANRSFGTISVDYNIFKDFTLTGRLGLDMLTSRRDFYNSTETANGLSAGGIGSIRTDEQNHWLAELFGTYNKTFNENHALTFLGGITFEEFDNRFATSSSQGFLSDVTGTNLLQSGDADEGDNVSSGRFVNRLNSFIGRVNYTLFDRYLLTASFRADGTSRFADDNKYAIFPSASLAWRISNESFLENSKAISNLKLRLGFGQLGNQAIGNFETIQTFVASGNAVLGNALVQGVAPARIPNSNLRWETSEEYNIGLDYGFFNGRLSGSIDYFNKTTRDQLFSQPVPGSSGFTNVRVNAGEVRNTGVEVFLESVNIDKEFKWTTAVNLATLNNQVTRLPDFLPEIISGNIGTFTSNFILTREGEALGSFYGFEVEGIFQEGDDIANSAQPSAQPGHPIFRDTDGDGAITPEDRVVLGKPLPDLTYGINNRFEYKGIGLDVLFIGVSGIEALNNNVLESLYPINFDRNRIAEQYLDRWTPNNPDARFPSGVNPSSYGGGTAVNSFTVNDASFFRLKTVTLSYQVPVDKVDFINNLSVYLAGDNLFTITDFIGYDPDANASGTGVNRTSYNSFPLNRTFRLGLNVGF
ncbi:SusC/RagA family TonB-linked outer membrane protein [Maribacter sp. 2307ULW6-5]|uniref:SusC/RagA family TonB-linked outer membrane protein n=1 Tax=Maribacter sp. 2307ULW6-5 TaxID=3386275 RepID=UPI0039BC870E